MNIMINEENMADMLDNKRLDNELMGKEALLIKKVPDMDVIKIKKRLVSGFINGMLLTKTIPKIKQAKQAMTMLRLAGFM